MNTKIGRAAFAAALRQRVPAIAAQLRSNSDSGLHNATDALLQHTLALIRAGDKEGVTSCFAFADWALRVGDAAVRNSLAVSYLEHLSFEGRKNSWAKPLLTPGLAQAWHDVDDYMRQFRGRAAPLAAGKPRRRDRRAN